MLKRVINALHDPSHFDDKDYYGPLCVRACVRACVRHVCASMGREVCLYLCVCVCLWA